MNNKQGGKSSRVPNSSATLRSALRSSATVSFTSLRRNQSPPPPKPLYSPYAMRQSTSSSSGFISLAARKQPAAAMQSQPAAAVASVPLHFHKKIVGKTVHLLDNCTHAIRDPKAYAFRIHVLLI